MFGDRLSRGCVVYWRVGLAPGRAAPLASGLVAVAVDAERHGRGSHPRQLHCRFGQFGQLVCDGRQPARVRGVRLHALVVQREVVQPELARGGSVRVVAIGKASG